MTKIYNKLVRDRIPHIIEESGKKANYHVLTEEEYKQALKDKLLEEINEFLSVETKEEMEEELGDIQTVCAAILSAFNIDDEKYMNGVMKKIEEKGYFTQRYFLESVEE